MHDYMQQGAGFLGLFNLFSGGGLEQLSIFALGIMPYVSSSIIFQLLGVVVPAIEKLQKEGEAGRRKINQYTRYGTIVLSTIQGIGIALFLEGQNASSQFGDVVREPGWAFRFITVISMTTGTAFIMWMGGQITERGLGNGISLIIFSGIVADLPDAMTQTMQQIRIGQIQPVSLLIVAGIALGVVAVIVFFERGQRRIPINHAKRMIGRKLYGGQSSHLPLKVNSAGVIPPIFASSLLMFPSTLANLHVPGMQTLQDYLSPGGWQFSVAYVLLIVFFSFFYTAVTFQPVEVADNLKKQSAVIPRIRPGKATAEYLDYVMTRVTVGGALYMALVCSVPSFLQQSFHVPFFFGGTSIMIVVGVALDTVSQIEAHLLQRHYEGLTGPRASRLRGRRD